MQINMDKKEKNEFVTPFILNAPKLKFKVPIKKPTPFSLNESSILNEESNNDIEDNFSLDEFNDFKKYIKANTLLIRLKSFTAQ